MKPKKELLRSSLGRIPNKKVIKEVARIKKPNTTNREGHIAYANPDELKLVSILNTSKLEPEFYRTESEVITEVRDLINTLALKDPYFVAQAIVWSRCLGNGMRSINHLAAALLAPFASGTEWGRRFYSVFDKNRKGGGCIYRLDDMSEIKNIFSSLNNTILTNAMKKGFRYVLEHTDGYQLAKYKKTTIDISNLVHPNPNNSKSSVEIDGSNHKVLTAILNGMKISANTWEARHVIAGQAVANLVKSSQISDSEAEKMLKEVKANNWKDLLSTGQLGILAAIRNIRNILKTEDGEIIESLCKLVSNGELLVKGKIMPYQLDMAIEVVQNEFCDKYSRMVIGALERGLELSVPNLKSELPGNNLVIVDCSGSMGSTIKLANGRSSTSCISKARLLAAMIGKATNADIIRFGRRAEYYGYNPSDSVFTIARGIEADLGGTDLETAFKLITSNKAKYDRIFIFSDNECNSGDQYLAYKDYVNKVNSPYIYSIDLCGYGTKPLSGPKVHYLSGYSLNIFTDITSQEFNPKLYINKIRKIKI